MEFMARHARIIVEDEEDGKAGFDAVYERRLVVRRGSRR